MPLAPHQLPPVGKIKEKVHIVAIVEESFNVILICNFNP